MPPVKFFESLDLDPIGLFLDGHRLVAFGGMVSTVFDGLTDNT
jgi:hypothetical protein